MMQNIFKKSKLINSKEFKVDEEFAQTLRRNLYENYLNSQKLSTMDKIKSFFGSAKLRPLYVVAILALLAGEGYYYWTSQTNTEVIKSLKGNLADIDGTVQIKKAGTTEWKAVNTGETLAVGDSIKTGELSRAVIEIDNGDAVRLNSSTEITLRDLMSNNVVIYQTSGEVYSRVVKSKSNHYYVISDEVETLALGTAYTLTVNPQKDAKVETYESTVRVTYKQKQEQVSAQNSLSIDLNQNSTDLQEFSGTEYSNEFIKWNVAKDEQKGLTTAETNAPVLTITNPAATANSTEDNIHLTGSVTDDSGLKKIIVNGVIYNSKDANGNGFNPADGTFDIVLPLNMGSNTITVKAFDVYWNATAEEVVTVTRTAAPGDTVTPTTPPNPSSVPAGITITSISSPQGGVINVKWSVTGVSTPNGFKIVRSTGANPTYPNNGAQNWDYVYLSNSNAREANFYNVPGGTYHVRVCVYNGSTCASYYSNDRTVNVTTSSTAPSFTSFTATYIGSNSVRLQWSLSGAWSGGYKEVWSTSANPTYPENTWHYDSASGTTQYTVTGLTPGQTYHFRVCLYDGACSNRYSVDRSIEVPALPTATPTTIPTHTPIPSPTI